MLTFEDMTNADVLAAWDKGEPVWTVEMGGIGPGYEQAIHIMAFEMLRAMLAKPFDYEHPAMKENWKLYVDEIEKVPEVKAVIEKIGPTGAQFGAAMNIASVFARQGYAKGMEMADKKRRIMVSKSFPSA